MFRWHRERYPEEKVGGEVVELAVRSSVEVRLEVSNRDAGSDAVSLTQLQLVKGSTDSRHVGQNHSLVSQAERY